MSEPNESSCESDQSIHHIKENEKNEETNKHYTATVKINGVKKKIKTDIGSTLTIMPMDKRIVKRNDIQQVTNPYQVVIKNEINFR